MSADILDKLVKNKRVEHIPIINILQVVTAIDEAEMELENERNNTEIRQK